MASYGDISPIVEQVTLFAVALRLGGLTILAGIVDVDVILNCGFSVFEKLISRWVPSHRS